MSGDKCRNLNVLGCCGLLSCGQLILLGILKPCRRSRNLYILIKEFAKFLNFKVTNLKGKLTLHFICAEGSCVMPCCVRLRLVVKVFEQVGHSHFFLGLGFILDLFTENELILKSHPLKMFWECQHKNSGRTSSC